MQTAIKRMEADIRDNAGNAGGNWPVGNGRLKGAIEHKAISNLKSLGNDWQGYRQWHDKCVNAMAQVHREYRTVLQLVVKAIEIEEKLPTGDIDDWEKWVNDREIVTINLKVLNESLFAVLMDKTESEAYFRVKSVEPGNGIEAFVKIFKWFMGTSGMGLQEKARQIMAPIPPKSEGNGWTH